MRLLGMLCVSLLLAGCLTSGKRGSVAAPSVYDLGAGLSKKDAAVPLTVTAIEVRAPLWLDTMGIDYRLLYLEPERLREYSLARWAGPPTLLIQQRLSQQLSLLPPGQGRANCVLRIELNEFAQLFDTPAHSRGVLQARVQLLDKARIAIADRDFFIEVPAESADSRGAVKALNSAVEHLAADLLLWEKNVSRLKEAAQCGFK